MSSSCQSTRPRGLAGGRTALRHRSVHSQIQSFRYRCKFGARPQCLGQARPALRQMCTLPPLHSPECYKRPLLRCRSRHSHGYTPVQCMQKGQRHKTIWILLIPNHVANVLKKEIRSSHRAPFVGVIIVHLNPTVTAYACSGSGGLCTVKSSPCRLHRTVQCSQIVSSCSCMSRHREHISSSTQLNCELRTCVAIACAATVVTRDR